MACNGGQRHPERGRDFLARLPLADQRQDLPFSARQAVGIGKMDWQRKYSEIGGDLAPLEQL
jgi:hypothetical protein